MNMSGELEEEWEKIRPILEKIPPEEVTRSIREDRDSGYDKIRDEQYGIAPIRGVTPETPAQVPPSGRGRGQSR